ncbi:hypothetical protein GCM10020367_12420 [Streptomyces sannanensis]|uniref:PLL-like beta propeller domain-containing protein n=1 Tax=Streptomyces sannanensis TaxID=285536 RepID=A0ABP6S6N9_9ACTN
MVHGAEHCRRLKSFGDFASLGGGMASGPSPVLNREGRIEVFARGTDNAVHVMYQNYA